jgi:hypothetical protein
VELGNSILLKAKASFEGRAFNDIMYKSTKLNLRMK